jgi:hypothetical protein
MTLLNKAGWELTAAVAVFLALIGIAIWRIFRRRPTPEKLELARRKFLVQSGRLVDGMLLDICDIPSDDGRTLKMLMFRYRIGGVDYECSQDITTMSAVVNPEEIRAGFPCTIRYQPGNPQNSIVVAEGWTGLRERLLQFPVYDDREPVDLSHLRPGRG